MVCTVLCRNERESNRSVLCLKGKKSFHHRASRGCISGNDVILHAARHYRAKTKKMQVNQCCLTFPFLPPKKHTFLALPAAKLSLNTVSATDRASHKSTRTGCWWNAKNHRTPCTPAHYYYRHMLGPTRFAAAKASGHALQNQCEKLPPSNQPTT